MVLNFQHSIDYKEISSTTDATTLTFTLNCTVGRILWTGVSATTTGCTLNITNNRVGLGSVVIVNATGTNAVVGAVVVAEGSFTVVVGGRAALTIVSPAINFFVLNPVSF